MPIRKSLRGLLGCRTEFMTDKRGRGENTRTMDILKLGAFGYLTKACASIELIKAIERIYKGSRYVSENVADILAVEIGSPLTSTPHEKLSDREFQVLLLIGSGKSTQNVSKKLSVSLSTVNTYRKRILDKMRLQSNLELIRYCIKKNLVEWWQTPLPFSEQRFPQDSDFTLPHIDLSEGIRRIALSQIL